MVLDVGSSIVLKNWPWRWVKPFELTCNHAVILEFYSTATGNRRKRSKVCFLSDSEYKWESSEKVEKKKKYVEIWGN